MWGQQSLKLRHLMAVHSKHSLPLHTVGDSIRTICTIKVHGVHFQITLNKHHRICW